MTTIVKKDGYSYFELPILVWIGLPLLVFTLAGAARLGWTLAGWIVR